MMRPHHLMAAALALAACDPETSDRSGANDFRVEELACFEPGDLYEPYEDDFVTISSPRTLAVHDGFDVTVDDKNDTVSLDDNGGKIFVCRCDAGCGGSACEIEVTPYVITCTGTCDGVISGDGAPCWGCGWHEAAQTDGGASRPPTADPTAGSLDPDFDPDVDPGFPGFDPTSGELDPTF